MDEWTITARRTLIPTRLAVTVNASNGVEALAHALHELRGPQDQDILQEHLQELASACKTAGWSAHDTIIDMLMGFLDAHGFDL